jgi:ABC-type branched-subunit amino acid transport system substrate-binding protein
VKNNVLSLAVLSLTAACLLGSASANAQKKYGPGVSDTEIKIGGTTPYSGPASAFSAVTKTELAYFKMINDQGGVNGRKINFIVYDDAYSPPKTVEQVRKLVESDEVLLTFNMVGTPPNSAVQKYLNQLKVPQLFAGTGADRFQDAANYPWTLGFNPSYRTEGRIYGQYILANHPNAKIGVFYQNDDLGKDYVSGLKAALGSKASSMIVIEESYELSEPSIDSHILKIKAAGADVLYDASTPKFSAQAIKKMAELEWKPVHILDVNSSSIGAVLKPAGLENSKGIISTTYTKDPLDPQWKNDPGMMKYFAFMEKYQPDVDKTSFFNAYGTLPAQLLVELLKRCGDDLTRENIMKQATNFKDIQLDLALPGILVNTSPTDYRLYRQMQLVRFDGEHWAPFGPIITAGQE